MLKINRSALNQDVLVAYDLVRQVVVDDRLKELRKVLVVEDAKPGEHRRDQQQDWKQPIRRNIRPVDRSVVCRLQRVVTVQIDDRRAGLDRRGRHDPNQTVGSAHPDRVGKGQAVVRQTYQAQGVRHAAKVSSLRAVRNTVWKSFPFRNVLSRIISSTRKRAR